ncbi:MAG: hypothetical protein J6386_26170 [Candidatus Synoicihabitans palmerolidicus]|nr:hypothetical protein [Candidatus Synoicihabitans palmerolidicus]MCC5023774.1 hypothetical protein [Candidatus Synoicihabitans palmerolidicus]MCC5023876.1 hypothetical protein [Candidatus Synoicihabitans palmerolidicus]MCC5025214.1 hypothetical protein [Candidatus Synoicihabitans palmerolidicus]MCC5025912.1 hypothetical protein [Candidatus Synoicihabitans palmerolidicus]
MIEDATASWINLRWGLPLTENSMAHFALDLNRLVALHRDPNAIFVRDHIADSRVGADWEVTNR